MERGAWPDERIGEKMSAIDHTFDLLHQDISEMRREITEELRGLRSDFSDLQGRLVQIGFGLVGVLITAMVALVVALVS